MTESLVIILNIVTLLIAALIELVYKNNTVPALETVMIMWVIVRIL